MARPPLPIGTHGKIATSRESAEGVKPEVWKASARVRDHDGVTRKVERRGASSAKATAELKSALRDRKVRSVGALTGDARFEQLALTWLDQVRARNKGTTYDTYRKHLHHTVLPALGKLRLRECTPGRLDEFLEAQDHLAPATKRVLRAILTGTFQLAVRTDALDRNPARDMSRITGDAKNRPVALTAEQLLDFMAKLDADRIAQRTDLGDLVRFLFGSGCRIGEALGMRWCDVNLTDEPVVVDGLTIPPRSLAVTGNAVSVAGKGVIRHDGKTFNARRLVTLPGFLHRLLTERQQASVGVGAAPVFPGQRGYRNPNATLRMVQRLRDRIGYPDFTTHRARKTVATILDGAGQSARKVADVLGHAQVSMTQNTYFGRGQANPEAAAALDAAVNPAKRTA
ncbi:tyrosine-type recombinase/integrase [Actinosynnema sp. NPDC002837]